MRLLPRSTVTEQQEALAAFGLSEQEAEADQDMQDIPWHCVICELPPNTARYTSGMHPKCRQEAYPRKGGRR